ncbi:hypothetical protein CA13_38000 [Planctomycetes bacterium CA13]|uniref:Uncharacterized protein n=1 Tax=Novipirellula herctigrandis TaxID=2527986 RepID=A0A5C5Z4T4_9BACT|nr:hypothetical protein CA13_38000 [Planctomycetes bacterium CA13]
MNPKTNPNTNSKTSSKTRAWGSVLPREYDANRHQRFMCKEMRVAYRIQFGWRRFLMISYWRLLV